MEQHYSAFISYKHAPLDIEVAKEVQSRLEHYVIPSVMAKKLGRKKIGRIFRDQEELPITVDLSKDIGYALEDADFLIVICSKSTKLSTWVPREIETFLKTHDQSHILTVLAEGEPSEVIPEILLRSQDEDGKALEPLSCDFRGNRRQARRTEIPRLAAALLGCSYDELIMRERQYKRKRFTIAAVSAGILVTAAISYLIWSNTQIRKNYDLAQQNYQLAQENYQKAEENRLQAEENYRKADENYKQALKNQSEFLAHESLRVVKEADRPLGVQLALAALPTELPDRPLSSTAQYALSESLRTYLPEVRTSIDITDVWSYQTQGTISSFVLSGDSSRFFAYDRNCNLYGWDVVSRTKLFSRSFDKKIDKIFTGGSGLFVQQNATLFAVDPLTGELLWSYEAEQNPQSSAFFGSASIYRSDTVGFYPTPDGVLCVISEEQYVYDEAFNKVSRCFFGAKLLSAEDGSVQTDGEWIEAESKALSFSQFAVSPDGALAAVSASYYQDGLAALLLIDLQELQVRVLPASLRLFDYYGMRFSDDCRSLMYHGLLVDEDGQFQEGGYSLNELELLTPTDIAVVCLDLETGTPVWNTGFRSGQLDWIDSNISGILLHPRAGAEDDRQLYAVIHGSTLYCFDVQDGTLFAQIIYSSGIVGYGAQSACTDSVVLHLHNGQLGMAYPLENNGAVFPLETFEAEFKKSLHAFYSGGYAILAQTDDHTVIQFGAMYDDSFQAFADQSRYDDYPSQYAVLGEYLVELDNSPSVNVYSLQKDRQLCSLDLSSLCDSAYDVRFLGPDPTQEQFYLTITDDNYSTHLCRIDLGAGTMTDLMPEPPTSVYRDSYLHCGGRLFYFSPEKLGGVCPLTIEGDDVQIGDPIGLPDPFLDAYGRDCIADAAYLLIPGSLAEDGTLSVGLLDTGSGSLCELRFPGGEQPLGFAVSPGQDRFAVASENRIVVYDRDGTALFSLTPDSGKYMSVYFFPEDPAAERPEQLLVLNQGGANEGLSVYRSDTGVFITSISMELESSYDGVFQWETDDSLLYLSFGRFYRLWVVDLSQNAIQTCVPYCGAWDRTRDRFLTILPSTKYSHELGWYPHFSWEELVGQAEEYLHGAVIDASVRARYGLSVE